MAQKIRCNLFYIKNLIFMGKYVIMITSVFLKEKTKNEVCFLNQEANLYGK